MKNYKAISKMSLIDVCNDPHFLMILRMEGLRVNRMAEFKTAYRLFLISQN